MNKRQARIKALEYAQALVEAEYGNPSDLLFEFAATQEEQSKVLESLAIIAGSLLQQRQRLDLPYEDGYGEYLQDQHDQGDWSAYAG